MLLLAVASCLLLQDQSTQRGEGIDAVIHLLKDMVTSFNVQSRDDNKNWDDYRTWSEDEEKDRNDFIQNQEGLIMTSTAQLNANKEQKETLERQLTELAGEIQQTTQSIADLVQLRTDEHKAHQDDLLDLGKTIEATNKAIEVLEGHYAAASVAQVKSEVAKALSTLALGSKASQGVTTLAKLVTDPNWLNVDGGAAYAAGTAGSGGGSVVDTLKEVRTTLLDNKQQSIEKENEARRQYEDAKSAKEQDLQRSKNDQAAKNTALEDAKAKMQQFTATIAGAQQDIADAQSYVQALVGDRNHFQGEFTKRAATRQSELEATQAGLDALQEVTVAGFVQQTAFVNAHLVACPKCRAAAQKLLRLGAETNEAQLVQIGTAIASQLNQHAKQQSPQAFFDPQAMAPVTDLLKQLIGRLQDELNAETSHHDWCNTEKATSNAAKAEREGNIASLTAEISQLETKIAGLSSEITFLHSELVRVQSETDKAGQIRAHEKATFESAKKEHDEVISALEKAVSALSGAFSFVQAKRSLLQYQVQVRYHQKQSPFADFGPSQGGSALDMLEDLLGRYSKARNELVQDEDVSQKAYDQLMARNEQFRKDTTQQKLAKETEKRQASERLTNAKADLQSNHLELGQVEQYLADLRPSCDDIRSTFEERKQRREAEIAALKETLAVLEDPSVLR